MLDIYTEPAVSISDYAIIVNPDDTHETLLHRRWLETYAHMERFLTRFLKNRTTSSH